ncbi:unnamed protein product [Sympodiomycopsis kandeliae]
MSRSAPGRLPRSFPSPSLHDQISDATWSPIGSYSKLKSIQICRGSRAGGVLPIDARRFESNTESGNRQFGISTFDRRLPCEQREVVQVDPDRWPRTDAAEGQLIMME